MDRILRTLKIRKRRQVITGPVRVRYSDILPTPSGSPGSSHRSQPGSGQSSARSSRSSSQHSSSTVTPQASPGSVRRFPGTPESVHQEAEAPTSLRFTSKLVNLPGMTPSSVRSLKVPTPAASLPLPREHFTSGRAYIYESISLSELDQTLAAAGNIPAELHKALLCYYDAYIDFCHTSREAGNVQGRTLLLCKLIQLGYELPQDNLGVHAFSLRLQTEIYRYGEMRLDSEGKPQESLKKYVDEQLDLVIRKSGLEADSRHASRGRLVFLGAAAAQKYRVTFINGTMYHHKREADGTLQSNYVTPYGARPFHISSLEMDMPLYERGEQALSRLESSNIRSSYFKTNQDGTLKIVQKLFNKENGFCCYVMDKNGCFYTAPHLDIGMDKIENEEAKQLSGFFHSSYLPAAHLGCSGTWHVVDGELRAITSSSGHFITGDHHLYFCLLRLKHLGVNISDVDVLTFKPPMVKDLVCRGKAPDFMKEFISGDASTYADDWSYAKQEDRDNAVVPVQKGVTAGLGTDVTAGDAKEISAMLRVNDLVSVAEHFEIDTSPTKEEKDWQDICRKIMKEDYLLKSAEQWEAIKDQIGDDDGEWV